MLNNTPNGRSNLVFSKKTRTFNADYENSLIKELKREELKIHKF